MFFTSQNNHNTLWEYRCPHCGEIYSGYSQALAAIARQTCADSHQTLRRENTLGREQAST